MIVKSRFTLDTNILVYAVDRDAGARHDAALDLVAWTAKADCLLTLQSLGEFFHATTRKNRLAADAAAGFVNDWMEVFDIAPAGVDDLAGAMELVADHRLGFWDAMLWATAANAGCAAILSEDMHDGHSLRGVEIINPFGDDAAMRLAPFLPRSV